MMRFDEFDDYWVDYCDRTATPFAENRGLAEEVWNAAQEAVLRPGEETENA